MANNIVFQGQVPISGVVGTSGIAKQRLGSARRIVIPNRILKKCRSAGGSVVDAGCITKEGFNTSCGVVGSGCVR